MSSTSPESPFPEEWPEEWPTAWHEAAQSGECVHCGNPLGGFWNREEGPFCCRGCLAVYRLIHEENLERYYDLKPDSVAPSAHLRADSFNWLDRLLSEKEASPTATPGMLQLELDIQGVHCAACVWLIEELFKRREAGIALRLNPTLGKVDLSWNPEKGDLKDFLAEIEKFGYRLGPSRKGTHKHSRALLMRMAISISMAMNVMMFSLSYYFGLAPEESNLYGFFGWLSLVLATISLIAGGGVFYQGALAGLKRRVAHLDLPISLGMTLAYAGSVWGFLHGGPEEAYFDSLTIFIALMLIGRWAQEHILERNRNTLLESSGAENLTVKRLADGEPDAIAATDVLANDELWIAPGDLLPVEGVLMRRSTQVALDWITGESDQIQLHPGDTVPAGAFNSSNNGFSVTATEDFADSRLQDLLRGGTVSDEEFRPRWWHNISTWYVALVLVFATLGFLVWMQDPTKALKVTVSILVVTCPCALGLATPLAEELVHFALRRGGVFLRKHSFMEKALSVRTVLLDKTGTLTMGPLALDEAGQQELLSLTGHQAAILRHMTLRSNHPVSQCLAAALEKMPRRDDEEKLIIQDEDLLEVPGAGLEMPSTAGPWRLGKLSFAAPNQTPTSAGGPRQTFFTCHGKIIAAFAMGEDLKADAAGELQKLRADGLTIYLLSGDVQSKVDIAADALGIPRDHAFGDLNPHEKAAKVKSVDNRDTLMVGDGLNDSPSFEVALCAATPAVDRPVLPGKADYYFLGDGIAAIRRSLQAARDLRKVVRDNLVLAILYNALAVALCLFGLVTPVIAAILMPISSVTVVSLTALRLATRRLAWM